MTELRVCRICGLDKELSSDNFYKRDNGFRWECKTCTTQNRKDHYQTIKDDRAVYIRDYYAKNKKRVKTKNKEYWDNNKKQISDYQKSYYQDNKQTIIAKNHTRAKERRRTDPVFRLRRDLSTRIFTELKKVGGSKNGSSILNHFPFTIQELKDHLERQFESWMTWENRGKYNCQIWDDNDISTWTWQLDHIIPQASLPYSSMEDDNFKKCWALSNLRPLSAKQNVIDGDRK